MEQETILALDPATVTGFAITPEHSGVIDLGSGSHADRFWRLFDWLRETLDASVVDLVVYEKCNMQRSWGVDLLLGYRTVIEMAAHEIGARTQEVSPKAIKKFATGSGKATKADMMQAALKQWPAIEVRDHNHADALWIREYAAASRRR